MKQCQASEIMHWS